MNNTINYKQTYI